MLGIKMFRSLHRGSNCALFLANEVNLRRSYSKTTNSIIRAGFLARSKQCQLVASLAARVSYSNLPNEFPTDSDQFVRHPLDIGGSVKTN